MLLSTTIEKFPQANDTTRQEDEAITLGFLTSRDQNHHKRSVLAIPDGHVAVNIFLSTCLSEFDQASGVIETAAKQMDTATIDATEVSLCNLFTRERK